MLGYQKNRLDYGTQLIPPAGYALDRAIAATFSLDLDTLLSIPVALHFSQTLDGSLTGERFQVLEAIKRAAKNVQLYCQAGRIKVPRGQNSLYAYVESMVTEILPSDAFESFHPKVWILRYIAEKQPAIYRVIVLSRNLTFDRSWDLAASFEGKVAAKEVNPNNSHLLKLLDYLNGFKPIEDYTTIRAELKFIDFDTIAGFEGSPRFVLSGVGGGLLHPVLKTTARRTLILSPFLHKETLEHIRKATTGMCWLFGRQEELRKIPAEVLSSYGEIYQISRRVVDGEQRTQIIASEVKEIDEDDANEIKEQNLHAKLFVFEEDQGSVLWQLGSANATEAGMTRNLEFGVELRGNIANVGINRLLGQLLGEDPDKPPLGVFEHYEPVDRPQSDEDRHDELVLRRLEHKLLGELANTSVTIKATEEKGKFNLTLDVAVESLPEGFVLRLRPFNTKTDYREITPEARSLLFSNIPEHELSGFIEVQILKKDEVRRQFLRKVQVVGMPETRMARIFGRVVENQASFLRYIQFLLQGEVSKSDLVIGIERTAGSSKGQKLEIWAQDSELYERLLVAASRSPRKLQDINSLLQLLQQDPEAERLIPATFREFWQTFAAFIPEREGFR